MLYAHYEGFSKFCLTRFYEEASERLYSCSPLPLETLALALSDDIRNLRKLPQSDVISTMQSFADYIDRKQPIFPDVDTQSNLWPGVLKKLLNQADVSSDFIDEYRSKINNLFSKRNKIAHGENSFIKETSYYLECESIILDLMYMIAYRIDERLETQPYS